jgi:hypothetical protein
LREVDRNDVDSRVVMKKKLKIKWRAAPEAHDYPAARSFLSLLFDPAGAAKYVERLRKAPISEFEAKDIFRASGMPLLVSGNPHVEQERKRVASGKSLSPLLLVRRANSAPVIIADGYHRLCAVYSFDEEAVVPCKIV